METGGREHLAWRFSRAGMVVDMRFPAMLFFNVPVRDMHMLDAGVVVGVAVSGEQVPPVLALMQVVSDVKVLVTVLDGLVLMTPRLRHQLPSPTGRADYSFDRTPVVAEATWTIRPLPPASCCNLLPHVGPPISNPQPARDGGSSPPSWERVFLSFLSRVRWRLGPPGASRFLYHLPW
jgi:hypothetical protein